VDLILEIVSPNGQILGAARRKVFGPQGGRIGRSPDCDWVIANPYISRHHATVRWISGTYYIESTGENGVAINAPQAMIPQRERRALRNGDRVFVDEYEMAVTIAGAASESAPPASGGLGLMGFAPTDDPLAGLVTPAQSPLLADPLEPSNDELDPLKQLSGGSPRRPAPAPTSQPEPNWNHTPGVLDQFTPPSIPPSASRASSSAASIPDDWDKTSFSRPSPPAPSTGGAGTDTAAGGRIAPIPDDWDKTSFSRPTPAAAQPGGPGAQPRGFGAESAAFDARPGGADAQPGMPGAQPVSRSRAAPLPLRPTPAPPAPQPAVVQQTPTGPQPPAAQQPLWSQQAPAAQQPPSSQQAPAAQQPPSSQQAPAAQQPPTTQQPSATQPAPAPATPPSAGNLDLTALLRAAGVDPASVPPDTAASLGAILRTVVQGAVEVLQARAEIKNEFRLPLTRIRTAENNPLKFAVNAEDALNALLGRRNPAYLGPVEAFEDAFDDIRFHQMAMLAGMRAGFEHALKRFDPERLQETFDKRGKRGGLLSGKSRYWELYAEEFRELTADPEDAFKRLFGEVFAGAYEQQLEQLKRSRRKPP
jgi:type VI secretion system FHA domain protein